MREDFVYLQQSVPTTLDGTTSCIILHVVPNYHAMQNIVIDWQMLKDLEEPRTQLCTLVPT